MHVFPGDSIDVPSTSSAVAGIHTTRTTGAISTRAGVLSSGGGDGGRNDIDMDTDRKKTRPHIHVAEQRRVGVRVYLSDQVAHRRTSTSPARTTALSDK